MALIYDNYLYIKITVIYNGFLSTLTSIRLILCLFSCYLFAHFSYSQNQIQGFQAGLRLGANFSQLDGDGLSGFDRIGLGVGLDITYPTSVNTSFSLGIHFDQRGSSTGLFSSNASSQHIHLNYVALPISYVFHQWWYQEYDRHKIRVKLIANPARLIGVSSSHVLFDNATDSFKRWDLSLGVAVAYAVGPRASLELGIQRGILKIFEIPNSQESALQSYWFSFSYLYTINQL